jgi:hypothetical protein
MKKIAKAKKRSKRRARTPFEQVIDLLNNRYTFGYGTEAEYDYDYHRECENGSYCCDNDYCRCGTIINASVLSIDPERVVAILSAPLRSTMQRYCVDRLLRITGAFSINSWEVNITGGYYGEEVHGVKLHDDIKNTIINELIALDKLSRTDKVKKLLELEYGYVLPRLKEASSIKISKVAIGNIKFVNDSYTKKVAAKDINIYNGYKLPRAVCTKSGSTYSIVDGYHRMVAAMNNKEKNVSIIELT